MKMSRKSNRCKYLIAMFFIQLFTKICGESAGVPRGHLQPLGSHRDPDSVEERTVDQIPTPLEFWNEFLMPSKPVVFRGAAKNYPGASLWTDSYLQEKYGNQEMRLEGKKEKDARMGRYPEGDLGIGRDTLKNFVKTYRNTPKYIVSELPEAMFHEAGVLPFMGCSPFRDHIVEVDMWMNGNNASSIMHKDAFNQLNCLYNGTKEWKLIAYKHEKKVYKREEAPGHVGGFSLINVSSVDLLRFPKFAEVPWQYTVLNAGDCLFLPGSMYHQVQSYGSQNLAVSLLFRRFQFEKNKSVDFGKCANESLGFETLDKYEPDLLYNGTGMMSMGNNDFKTQRRLITDLYTKKGKLSLKRILKALKMKGLVKKKESKESKDRAKEIFRKIYKLFGDNTTPTKVMLANKTIVREISIDFEPFEPTNSYDLEYNVVQAEDILKLLRIGIKEGNGKGTRQDFIKQYCDTLLGTVKFANRFLNTLAGNDSEFFTLEHVKKNLKAALKPYLFEPERWKEFNPGPDHDVGDIERAQVKEHSERLKNINDADDFSVFEGLFDETTDFNDDDDDDDSDEDNESGKEGGAENDSSETSEENREDYPQAPEHLSQDEIIKSSDDGFGEDKEENPEGDYDGSKQKFVSKESGKKDEL